MTENTNAQPKMTEVQAINKMVDILIQIEGLNEVLKGIKDECKDLGYDQAAIASVAKAIVSDKVATLEQKSTALLDLIEMTRK